jgi:hypothetical protein
MRRCGSVVHEASGSADQGLMSQCQNARLVGDDRVRLCGAVAACNAALSLGAWNIAAMRQLWRNGRAGWRSGMVRYDARHAVADGWEWQEGRPIGPSKGLGVSAFRTFGGIRLGPCDGPRSHHAHVTSPTNSATALLSGKMIRAFPSPPVCVALPLFRETVGLHPREWHARWEKRTFPFPLPQHLIRIALVCGNCCEHAEFSMSAVGRLLI